MNTRFLPIAVLALCAAACANDDENLNDGPVAAVINAEISDAVAARAGGTRWATNDEIGVSESRFGYANVPYRWENGKFTPTGTIIFFQDDNETTFSAYYPYDSNGGTLTAATDAAAQQNQPAIDFLYAAGAAAGSENPEVNFRNENTAGENDPAKDHSFHHCMSRITLTFEAGSGVDFSAIKPTGYSLSGLVLEGSFDTATGTAEADDAAAAQDLDMTLTGGALASSVILFPQAATSVELSVYYNSQPYTATLSVPGGALEAGNNYAWTVTVRNKDLSIGSAEITPWNKVEDTVDADL